MDSSEFTEAFDRERQRVDRLLSASPSAIRERRRAEDRQKAMDAKEHHMFVSEQIRMQEAYGNMEQEPSLGDIVGPGIDPLNDGTSYEEYEEQKERRDARMHNDREEAEDYMESEKAAERFEEESGRFSKEEIKMMETELFGGSPHGTDAAGMPDTGTSVRKSGAVLPVPSADGGIYGRDTDYDNLDEGLV